MGEPWTFTLSPYFTTPMLTICEQSFLYPCNAIENDHHFRWSFLFSIPHEVMLTIYAKHGFMPQAKTTMFFEKLAKTTMVFDGRFLAHRFCLLSMLLQFVVLITDWYLSQTYR
jgi:hypothetical protein